MSFLSRRSAQYALLTGLCLTGLGLVLFAYSVRVSGSKPASPQIRPEAVLKETPIEAFVPAGIPFMLSNSLVVRDKSDADKSEASTKIQTIITASAPITSFNLLLLEFSPAGKLSFVEGWLRNDDLGTGRPVVLTLEVARRITSANRLMLVVERVNSSSQTLSVDFAELAEAAMASSGNRPPVSPALMRSAQTLPDDFGAEVCSNSFRRAMAFAQSREKKNDAIGISTITCNQSERSFAFGYSDKKDK